MSTITKFIDLSNVTDQATATTVALFNSCRPIKTDKEGKQYTWKAVQPQGSGVIAIKEYKETA